MFALHVHLQKSVLYYKYNMILYDKCMYETYAKNIYPYKVYQNTYTKPNVWAPAKQKCCWLH